ncbi:MAG TPA: GNAT family N-acetyltransferase [Gaiellaceae bacterium]
MHRLDEAMDSEWRSREPPTIDVDAFFVLDRCRPHDGAALRRFDLDPATARFFGWTVDQARALSEEHYEGVKCAQERLRAWHDRKKLLLMIRRRSDDAAVGWVELRPKADHAAEVSYMVDADLRGRGLAPRALEAFLSWALLEIELREVRLACHVENAASRRVAEKCNFALIGQEEDEYRFSRTLVGEPSPD